MALGRIRKVGFVGTGLMGSRIAGHILDAGYGLTVYNRTRDKAQELLDRGAAWAENPAAVAAASELVFTMVGTPDDVEDVYLGSNGLLEAAHKGTWLVDLTTSSPRLAAEIHDAAEVEDKHAVDCPVTGGVEGAEAGTLTLMVGAKEGELDELLPVLKTFSSKIYYFDHPGAGQTAKLCNQVSLASCMVGYADALALAEQAGLDRSRVLEMISSGMGGSVALERLAPKSLAGDYKPGFMIDHLHKDLGLALEEAFDADITLPGAEMADNLYEALVEAGGGKLGTQAITLLYEQASVGEAAGLDWSSLMEEQREAGNLEHDHAHDHEGHAHVHEHGEAASSSPSEHTHG